MRNTMGMIGLRPLGRLGAAVTALILLLGVATPARACPDWQQTGQQISLSASQLARVQSFAVVAGGRDRLADCPQPGSGYVATRPDFDMTLSGNGTGLDLVLSVQAECDTVLLVNDARGNWHFDDDGGHDLNAQLRIAQAPDGLYDIWVGTFGAATCQATLQLQMAGADAPPAARCPDPRQNGQLLALDAAALQAGQRFSVVAGGDIDLGGCGSVPGTGHVIERPDFTLNLTANPLGADLEFRIEAGCDPVLLVHGPDGRWQFNDDDDGLNSRLRLGAAAPGEYDVWVGTFGAATCQATLIAQSVGGRTPPRVDPPAAGRWRIDASGHAGTLILEWDGRQFAGRLRFDSYGVEERLEAISYDPASGRLSFTRFIAGATQIFRATVADGAMAGQFNQEGGDFIYGWRATRSR